MVVVAEYNEDVAKRQTGEKEKVVRRQKDVEMRSVEISLRGLKRKAFRKETPKEKADRGRKAAKEIKSCPVRVETGQNVG